MLASFTAAAVLSTWDAPAAASTHTLGPGAGPWQLSNPASVGLSQAKLERAAEQLKNGGSPLCLAVAKAGQLVLDRTFGFGEGGGGQGRPIESYSAGKTITAALMGAAYSKRLFELHRPLVQYGVPPRANWSNNPDRVDYYPNLTAHHLLTQTCVPV